MAAFWMWSSLLTLVGLTVAHVHAQALTALASFNGSNGSIPLCRFNALRQHPVLGRPRRAVPMAAAPFLAFP